MTQQQQPTTGLEYQIRLLELEAQHYQENKFGAPHLIQAVARVAMYAPAITAAREALEWTLEQAEAWLGNYTGGPGEDEYREQLQQARAALQHLKGVQP